MAYTPRAKPLFTNYKIYSKIFLEFIFAGKGLPEIFLEPKKPFCLKR